jgi:hypothetical protein
MVDYNVFNSSRLDERSDSYCPVNTGLINAAASVGGENFKVDGEQINMIEIVAKVRNYLNSSMKLEVELYDEFGLVNAVLFKKNTEEPKQLRNFRFVDSGYVRCFGQLKRFYSSTSFVISIIRNVNVYSEVTCHKAKVIWASLYRRGKLRRSEHFEISGESIRHSPYVMPSQHQLIAALQPDQQQVLQTITTLRDRQARTDKDSIFESLSSRMGVSVFEGALMMLTETGFIYKDDDCGIYYVS